MITSNSAISKDLLYRFFKEQVLMMKVWLFSASNIWEMMLLKFDFPQSKLTNLVVLVG